MKSKKIILICGLLTMVCGLTGCDAFVRKFTRKPKKTDLSPTEMVLVPEEYKERVLTKEEAYHQYFLFWKSWQDELITSLTANSNQKKQIDCVKEAIKNLEQLKPLLQEDKLKKLDFYISQLKGLQDSIAKDLYAGNLNTNRLQAERIKRNILRDLSFNAIKDYLI
jgi:DNA repair ATPase RecN